MLPTPTKVGFSFKGWYTSSSGGSRVSESTTVTMTTAHTLFAQWESQQYSVQWSGGSGYLISVSRTSSPYAGASTGSLSNGSTVYYGDNLKVTYTAENGFTLTSTGTDSITVNSNITSSSIWAKASPREFSASWNTGRGYSITVKRTSSPYANASIGSISNGGTVYYGDSLSISYSADTGYSLTSTGASSLTVSGNIGSGDIYANASIKQYGVSWNTGGGYSITVKRTSSPYASASMGSISNGSTVYYGDSLSISYSADAGYTLTSTGAQSVTVSGDVTSSTIYASVRADSYTYNIKYVSSNGTSLGSSSATYNYGTTNTITPKSISGYITPSSQTIKWDSAGTKTITFTYTPSSVGSSSTGSNVYSESGSRLSYTATVECISRTSTSAQISITLTATLTGTGAYNTYSQWFNASAGSASSGSVQVAPFGTWSSKSSSARSESGSTVLTVPLSSTDATSVTVSIYYFQANYNGTEKGSSASSSCSVAIPAY